MKLKETVYAVKGFVTKHSPEILVATGIASAIGATVLAVKATTKAEVVIEDIKDDLEAIDIEESDPQVVKKEKAKVFIKGAGKLALTYAPTTAALALSTASILGAYGIVKKRNAALTAAYATCEKMFRKYRENVVSEFGEEVDTDMMYGRKRVKKDVMDEDGNKTKQEINVFDADKNVDVFSRFFGPGYSNQARDDVYYNKNFIVSQQNWWNNVLTARCYPVTLNEVLVSLGFDPIPEGQHYGWHRDISTDGIDFGVLNGWTDADRRFVNLQEEVALLRFNCCYIFDKF